MSGLLAPFVLCRRHGQLARRYFSSGPFVCSQQKNWRSEKSVAIVGAGPGGLTLARILQTHNVPVTVYERDSSSEARTQGGTLDLHPETGQRALQIAGLTAEFKRLARNEGEDLIITDKDANICFKDIYQGDRDARHSRPEIDRGDLRAILLASIDPERIKWGKTVSAIKPATGRTGLPQTTVEFRDGSSATADLVVGADGAWSRVRRTLTPLKPHYSGVTLIELQLTEVSKRHREIGALVGRGNLFAVGSNRSLVAQMNSRDNIRVYAQIRCAEAWATENSFKGKTPEEEQAVVLSHFEDWHPSLRRLITDANPGFIIRQIFELPMEALRWAHVPGVTLVGDAAHLMVPSGEGVNLSMLDAVELAEALVGQPTDFDAAVRKYEEIMFSRSEAKTVESQETLNMLLEENGPDGAVAFFKSHTPPPE